MLAEGHQAVAKESQAMLNKGVILVCESNSPWSSSVELVAKKNCMNYRRLTGKDPLPNVESLGWIQVLWL
jgi:hypothetical protein